MSEDDWGTWESKRASSHARGRLATPEERLAWVEEMLELAFAAGAKPKPRDEWGNPLPGPIRPPHRER